MSKKLFKRMRWGLVLCLVLVLLAAAPASRPQPAAAQMEMGANGMVCTHGPSFTLTTQTGYVGTPDDNIVYMWGFSAQGMPFEHRSSGAVRHPGRHGHHHLAEYAAL